MMDSSLVSKRRAQGCKYYTPSFFTARQNFVQNPRSTSAIDDLCWCGIRGEDLASCFSPLATKLQPYNMGRGPGYSPKELNHLLNIIEKRLPVDASEWVEVAHEHRLTWKFEKRGMESIKRKFMSLYRRKTPVRDTTFTRRAIKIMRAIRDKKYGITEQSVPNVIHIHPKSVQKSDGCKYSDLEAHCLLDIIEKRLPVDDSEWIAIMNEHQLAWFDKKRSKSDLQSKFASLCKTEISASDSDFPVLIRRANKILNEIREKDDLTVSSVEDDSSHVSSDDSFEELLSLDGDDDDMEDLLLLSLLSSGDFGDITEDFLLYRLMKSRGR